MSNTERQTLEGGRNDDTGMLNLEEAVSEVDIVVNVHKYYHLITNTIHRTFFNHGVSKRVLDMCV